MSLVEVDRIACFDAQENEYVVIVLQNMLLQKEYDGISKGKGLKKIILSDGRDINMIGTDFKVFELLDDNKTRIKAK